MMGLRLDVGVNISKLNQDLALKESDYFDMPIYEGFLEEGVLQKADGFLKLGSIESRLLLNHILSKILA